MTEEKRLRAQLTRLYCTSVAIVLIAVLSALAALFFRDAAAQNRESFTALLHVVSEQIGGETIVRHPALRELERQNGVLLSLGDSGQTLLYNTGDSAALKAIFSETERRAKADGFDTDAPPLTKLRRYSPLYSFTVGGKAYLGAVSILPGDAGYRTVTMARRVYAVPPARLLLLLLGYLISLATLCFVGSKLVARALQPAVESRMRQTRFIAAASHELRSPLAVIAANASLARAGGSPDGALHAIESECARLSRLIGDLTLLASADARDWTIDPKPTQLDAVLLDLFETQAPLFSQAGCVLELDLPEDPLPSVRADAERLTQALCALLDNALFYGTTREIKTVSLVAAPDKGGVCIRVIDHGAGLPDERKAQVFERFCRGDAAHSDKRHFGLGLSIVSVLVERQGGTVACSDTPGGGCTFTIRLKR